MQARNDVGFVVELGHLGGVRHATAALGQLEAMDGVPADPEWTTTPGIQQSDGRDVGGSELLDVHVQIGGEHHPCPPRAWNRRRRKQQPFVP